MEEFIMPIYFAGEEYFFLFSEIFTGKGKQFFVTTTRDGKSTSFVMSCDKSNHWKLIGTLPLWIRQMEEKIIEGARAKFKGSD